MLKDDNMTLKYETVLKVLEEVIMRNIGDSNYTTPSRETEEYKKMRESVRKRDNYKCQCCGYDGTMDDFRILEVHHIYGYKNHKDYRNEESNCILLCNECHKLYHNIYGRKNANPLSFSKFIRDYGG